MCAACGISSHISAEPAVPTAAGSAPTVARSSGMKFAALRHPDCRFYLFGTMLSMMADNVEHVISNWIIFLGVPLPTLVGFAVISH